MPINKGKDKKGTFYRWGKSGKKYYGKNAKEKALAQARAAYANGYVKENMDKSLLKSMVISLVRDNTEEASNFFRQYISLKARNIGVIQPIKEDDSESNIESDTSEYPEDQNPDEFSFRIKNDSNIKIITKELKKAKLIFSTFKKNGTIFTFQNKESYERGLGIAEKYIDKSKEI